MGISDLVNLDTEHLGICLILRITNYNYCHYICSFKLFQQLIRYGAPGIVVQRDESVFVKATYNIGHVMQRQPRWVFCIDDTHTKQTFIKFVNFLDKATLLQIIQQIVIPNILCTHIIKQHTTISQDCHIPTCLALCCQLQRQCRRPSNKCSYKLSGEYVGKWKAAVQNYERNI